MDGSAFADLSARQEELAAHREELEKQKKQTSRKKGSVGSSQREQLEKEEILKIRAAVLKKVSLGPSACWESTVSTLSGRFCSQFGTGKIGTRAKPAHTGTEAHLGRGFFSLQNTPNSSRSLSAVTHDRKGGLFRGVQGTVSHDKATPT